MSFDWCSPECTATCFIIVTIVEIYMLIIDVSVSKYTQSLLIRTTFKKYFGLYWKPFTVKSQSVVIKKVDVTF